MQYDSLDELVRTAEDAGLNISEIVITDQMLDCQTTREKLFSDMEARFDVMVESIENGLNNNGQHPKLCENDALKLKAARQEGKTIGGDIIDNLTLNAVAVASQNACMGKIVASPTAGSCGIIPAVLYTAMKELNIPKEKVIMSLFTAGGIGMVIANRATLSGAEGGCQAECGSAAAMAAGALVELCGGTPQMAADACALALKNSLGLVCDPVAGLVEVPCIKRNAVQAVVSWTAANMALAGVKSVIPADEVIDAMKSVGSLMSSTLRETAEGGLAATPTGREIMKRFSATN